MPFSIGGIINDTKLTLEKSAVDKFGSVVEDFAKDKLSGLLPGGAAGGVPTVNRNDGSWYATSYAASLAGWDYRPKLKFMFKVEFIFSQAAIDAFNNGLKDTQRNSFTFMIKQVDRPKIDFEYEEDINMYNFRTKVLKKIRHRPLSMVFMDDVGNRVFDFVRTLMMIHQPITERSTQRDNSLRPPDPSFKSLTSGSGMTFSSHDKRALSDTAHRGVLNPKDLQAISYGNSIECIRVKQIFVNPASGSIDTASQMTSFDFINPRIESFDFDELSHETNDVSLLTMTFDYDWMEMVKVGPLGLKDTQYDPTYNIPVPGVNGAPSDITPNHVGAATGPGSAAGGAGNPLTNAISGIFNRGVAQLSSDTIGKLVKTVAGNGRFATAIAGVTTNALTGPITGIISGGARDLLSNVSNPFSSLSKPAEALASSSSDGTSKVTSVVSSAGFVAKDV